MGRSVSDPLTIHASILQILASIEALDGRVYDGYVPDAIPKDDAGFPLPYVVLFAGAGNYPDEPLVDGSIGADGLIFDFQTTAVGPLTGHAVAVASMVRATLINTRVGRGRIKPSPDGFNQQAPIRDTNITPARFFLPQQWRLQTN